MALNPQSASQHNQMITRFIKHPKSTNFDGANDRPAKRQKTSTSPKKPPPTPRKSAHRREVPDSDAENDEIDIKNEEKDEEEHKTDLESALPPIKVDDEAIEAYEAFKASQEPGSGGRARCMWTLLILRWIRCWRMKVICLMRLRRMFSACGGS
jgi:Fanconi-associated nuclease 1